MNIKLLIRIFGVRRQHIKRMIQDPAFRIAEFSAILLNIEFNFFQILFCRKFCIDLLRKA